MAEQLGLSAGGQITLVSPDGDVTPLGVNPRVKTYHVSGIFEIGMSEYRRVDHLHAARRGAALFQLPKAASCSRSSCSSTIPTMSTSCAKPIEAAAERQIFITDWRQRNQTFFSALQVERNVMFMILTLIVLVAALNIISGLIMLVKDKGSDIAILRTMGATSRRDHAHLLDDGRCDRHGRHLRRRAARRRRLPQRRAHPAVLLVAVGHRRCSIRNSISSASCRPT
jgi:lipoprotein-releasing system permease protein